MESDNEVHYTETEYQVDEEEEFARQIADLADEENTGKETFPNDQDTSAEQEPAQISSGDAGMEADSFPAGPSGDHESKEDEEGQGVSTDSQFVIAPEVLEVLEEKWEEWKNGNKGERKRCWKELASTLRRMEVNQTLEKPAWILRQGVSDSRWQSSN